MDETFVYVVPNGGTMTYDKVGGKQVIPIIVSHLYGMFLVLHVYDSHLYYLCRCMPSELMISEGSPTLLRASARDASYPCSPLEAGRQPGK